MAHWQRTLHIQDIWQASKKKEITIQELSQSLAKKLRSLTPFYTMRYSEHKEQELRQWLDIKKEDIIADFECLA